MAGRGRSTILQALKEKKERERSESPSSSSARQPLQTAPATTPVPTSGVITAPSATATTTSGLASVSSALPIGRGVGRGQLANLLAASRPSLPSTGTSPSSTDQVLFYSPEKASQPIPKRISPIEPLGSLTLPETTVAQPYALRKTSTLREVLYILLFLLLSNFL